MKLVKIFKNSTLSFFSKFESEQESQEWIDSCVSKNTWGLPERPELALNEETGEMEPTEVILPAEYTIEIEEITAQIEQEKINAEAKKFLSETDWKVIRHQDQKALDIATSLTDEEFMALLNERQLQRQRVV